MIMVFRAPGTDVSLQNEKLGAGGTSLGFEKYKLRNRKNTKDELQRAIIRVKNKGKKLSISAVAVEAGVTPGLIHNTYPDIAETIRAEVGKSTRQSRDEKITELVKAREKNKELRVELGAALTDIQRLASVNETLRQELTVLRAEKSGKVAVLPRRNA